MRSVDRLRTAVTLACLAAVLAVAGCGDSLPVEDRALVLGIGVDPSTPPGGDLQWTFTFPNVTATASNVASLSPHRQVYDVQVRAPDLSTAVGTLQDTLARQVYMGDLEVLAVGLGTPSSRVRSLVSDLVQLAYVPDSFLVVATPDPSSRLLTLPTRQDVIPRYFLTSYVDCRGCHAFDLRSFGWRWWAASRTPGDAPRAMVLRTDGSNFVTTGMAVYASGPAPAAVMPPHATQGLGYLGGRATKAVITDVVGGQRISVTHVTDTAFATARLQGGRVRVAVSLYVRGALTGEGKAGDESARLRTARDLVARDVLHDTLAALGWANAEHRDPFGYTADALLAAPRLAYALPAGATVWYPLDASVTVHADVTTAGTAE